MRPRWRPFLGLFLLLAAPSAQAQSASVKELYDNGQMHYDSGQFDLAVEAWSEAHRLSGRPLLLIKLADAHEALGHLDEAVELLERYRESAEVDEVGSITLRIETLRGRLAAAMEPEVTPEPEPEIAPEPGPEPVPPPPARKRSIALDLTLGGLTATGLGVGTGFGLSALSARTTAMESCAGERTAAVCTGGANDALQRDRTHSALADIGFAVGGAAAAAWTVSAVVRPKASDLQIAVTPTGAIVTWKGR